MTLYTSYLWKVSVNKGDIKCKGLEKSTEAHCLTEIGARIHNLGCVDNQEHPAQILIDSPHPS